MTNHKTVAAALPLNRPGLSAQNLLVLFLHQNQSRSVLYNDGDILVVACRSTGSVCVLLGACVDVSMCFQEGNSSVCMVCRPCAGLWGVDCWVHNRGLLMHCLWDLALVFFTVFALSHCVCLFLFPYL